jgi:hypothetical protein
MLEEETGLGSALSGWFSLGIVLGAIGREELKTENYKIRFFFS